MRLCADFHARPSNIVVLVLVLSRFNTVFPKERGSNVRESRPFSQDDLSNPQICSTRVGLEVWTTARSYGIKVTKRISLNSRIRTQAFTWNKHGFLLLAAPERSLLIDITISMDVELNPGPSASADATVLSTCESRTTEHYHRNQLLALHKYCYKPSNAVLTVLKDLDIISLRTNGIETMA